MVDGQDLRIARELTGRILAGDGGNIRRIILYGSRARGTADPDSDFDFLVVESDPAEKRERLRHLCEVVDDLTCLAEVWVMGETEFEETKNIIGGLAYPAHKYGRVLYENS